MRERKLSQLHHIIAVTIRRLNCGIIGQEKNHESNNKRFNAYLINTDYADVVNGTVRNRCVFTENYCSYGEMKVTGKLKNSENSTLSTR